MLLTVSKNSLFWRGFRKTLPYQGGLIPFGVLYATLATGIGFPWWLTIAMSIIVLGGSSQLVFIDLMKTLGSPLEAVLGANIVNARHFIYSAALSQKFANFSLKWKLLLSYMMTDHLYAISETDTDDILHLPPDLAPWYYFGSAFVTLITWILSAILGVFFGKFIPHSWNLDFSIPLMFMPLVFSVSKSRYAYLTCLFAIVFVFLLRELPLGLGVFLSILLSSFLAFLIQKRRS